MNILGQKFLSWRLMTSYSDRKPPTGTIWIMEHYASWTHNIESKPLDDPPWFTLATHDYPMSWT